MEPYSLDWWLKIYLKADQNFRVYFYDYNSTDEEVKHSYQLKEWIKERILKKYGE